MELEVEVGAGGVGVLGECYAAKARINIRDLKQTRTATAVNKQLNFTVKKQTTHNQLYTCTLHI